MSASAYEKLRARAREVYLLRSSSAILQWDEETYLPPKAVPFRAEQLSFLEARAHLLATEPKIGDWLKACEDHGYPAGSDEAANVREWRREYDRATKLPVELVEEFERVCALARDSWKHARRESDFTRFAPDLTKVLELSRRRAELWGFVDSPYDALLEGYEPGATVKNLQPIFQELQPALIDLLNQVGDRSVPEDFLKGEYPINGQQALNQRLAAAFGYDFEAGRVDQATHPFMTTLGPADQRITTRYDERMFQMSFYGVLHEIGHALYEQGLNKEAIGTPLGSARSNGIHESQSRLWENHVGRSRQFWHKWHGTAGEHLPWLKRFTPDDLVRGVQRIAPSFIRVEADEVTYDLHILLRFEIEVALIEKRIDVKDLPAVWNQRFKELFGLVVPTDSLGVLQDIHWSMGGFGYFPTYSLGNLNAAQLMAAAEKSVPHFDQCLAAGDYGPLLDWLRANVHEHGQRYSPSELMTRATGEPTQARYRIDYLRKKYL
jgi:carboxypeptidase Taq